MSYEVTEADTATALGSGDVPVLATPRLIAWMEAATVRAAEPYVGAGQTTVGTAIRVEHRRATPVGDSVEITATPPQTVTGRHLTFGVEAVDGSGHVVAVGEIDRVIDVVVGLQPRTGRLTGDRGYSGDRVWAECRCGEK